MAHTTVFATRIPEGERRVLAFEGDAFQVLHAQLAGGEELPRHTTNSNVLLGLLEGAIELGAEGRGERVGVGQVCFLPVGTEMHVANHGTDRARFLIVKAPHPRCVAGSQ